MLHEKKILLCFTFIWFLCISVLSDSGTFSWVFQQPTYLLEKDTPLLASYTCDTSKEACKVNFDFTSSVPTDAPSTHYACLIDFWFWVTGQENKCNPSTVEFPVGNWAVRLIVKRIADETIMTEWIVTIVHPDGAIDPLRVTHSREWQSPSYLLAKDDTSLIEYVCDPEESECKINLKVTPLLDGVESTLLTCEISSDFELVPTTDTCNPNTSIVPTWEHIVTIKILDKEGTILQTSTLTLKNIPPDTTIDPTRVVTDIVWQQPTYLLEKEDTSKSEYTCDPERTECKINLLVTPKLDGLESTKLTCHITSDFGLAEDDCNPDTVSVPNGSHTLTIETINTADASVISTRILQIHGLSVSPASGSDGGSVPSLLDLSSSKILVQSGLDESFVCKTDICQVNFLAEVPSWVLCEWNFWTGIFETAETDKKCNPGYVKFSWDSDVSLTVIDPNMTSNTVMRTLRVLRTKHQIQTIDNIVLNAHIGLQTKLTASKRLTRNGILCIVGKSGTCSLNFSWASSIGAKTWYWDFWDGTMSNKENPPSHAFPVGNYTVKLIISDGTKTHETSYDVEVTSALQKKEPCLECASFWGKLEISAVLPNPPHTDTVEWIEIRNTSSETFPLDACELADESESFELSGSILWGVTIRLRQAITGLNMWNTHDILTLTCGEVVLDTFGWDFQVPTSYILRREVLRGTPVQSAIMSVIDGDTVDAVIDGKKTRIRLLWIDTPEAVHPRKPVEQFGKEASDFTRRMLEWKTVWLTFDTEPVDHYGRRLAYVWQCNGIFSEQSCTLFNEQIVSEWYGRMERRFWFRFYEPFDALEKEAKEKKIGLWSDPEVAKAMTNLSSEERDALTSDQEKEYLLLQEELLVECQQEDLAWCEEKKPSWKEITETISTLTVSQKKSGIVTISGRTWWDFPLKIGIYEGEHLVQSFISSSNDVWEYELTWIPEKIGNFVIRALFEKETEIVQKEKPLAIEFISPHFENALTTKIVLQGQITDNRWLEWDVFHCRSRGSCSVNVTAETNREEDVTYFWIFPDGSVSDEKNPLSTKLEYGQYEILLFTYDDITGEIASSIIQIDHRPIPKKAKSSSKSTKYTLDLKDVPEDIGGGVVLDTDMTLKGLIAQIVLVLILWGFSFAILKK
jgi:endonuclease YncB( thermonuclease family)